LEEEKKIDIGVCGRGVHSSEFSKYMLGLETDLLNVSLTTKRKPKSKNKKYNFSKNFTQTSKKKKIKRKNASTHKRQS